MFCECCFFVLGFFFGFLENFLDPPCGPTEVLNFVGGCRTVECGGTHFNMSGVIETPNWPNPSSQTMFCEWAIVLPDERSRVNIVVDEMDITQDNRNICFWNYVVFFDSVAQNGVPPTLGQRHCGTEAPDPFLATGNIVNIWYQSSDPPNAGFSLTFSATPL